MGKFPNKDATPNVKAPSGAGAFKYHAPKVTAKEPQTMASQPRKAIKGTIKGTRLKGKVL